MPIHIYTYIYQLSTHQCVHLQNPPRCPSSRPLFATNLPNYSTPSWPGTLSPWTSPDVRISRLQESAKVPRLGLPICSLIRCAYHCRVCSGGGSEPACCHHQERSSPSAGNATRCVCMFFPHWVVVVETPPRTRMDMQTRGRDHIQVSPYMRGDRGSVSHWCKGRLLNFNSTRAHELYTTLGTYIFRTMFNLGVGTY